MSQQFSICFALGMGNSHLVTECNYNNSSVCNVASHKGKIINQWTKLKFSQSTWKSRKLEKHVKSFTIRSESKIFIDFGAFISTFFLNYKSHLVLKIYCPFSTRSCIRLHGSLRLFSKMKGLRPLTRWYVCIDSSSSRGHISGSLVVPQ